MIALAWYLLKVIICSGILCGYYYLALRNKIFHRWNRFYLLASAVLALAVPLMKINVFQNAAEDKGTVIRMLQTINSSDEIIIEYSKHGGLQFNSANFISAAYILITLAFLSIFFIALYKISRLKKKYPATKMKGISFISTDAKGTPFSFFNSIFWNNAIDLHSRQGQQIFNHEIAHVKEKHSYDKIFMNVLLIFFWMNPFFWLMRKELSMIHEFIADKEALEDSDISAFAEMVLQTVYPGKFSITNNFFHSPIKRRLLMFTKNKNPKVSYLSRLLVLPLAAIVFFAFTLKMKTINSSHYSGKKITVVIDAGHGGSDNGAISPNGLLEKDINLSIAKKIAAINSNSNINILLSRENDKAVLVKDRLEFANSKHADLFISIHTNADKDHSNENGFSVFIDKNNSDKNKLLASSLINELKKSYKTDNTISVSPNGSWVLDKNICPAALIECGYLTNPADEEFINNNANQEKIAQNILNAIEIYAEQNLLNRGNIISIAQDTTPKAAKIKISSDAALFVVDGKIVSKEEATAIDSKAIQSVDILKGESAIKKYGEKGKNGVVEITKKKLLTKETENTKNTTDAITSPVYFYDGKEISKDEMKEIPPNHIESINVLKGENAIKKYGEKGKNGVVEIHAITRDVIKDSNGSTAVLLIDKVSTKSKDESFLDTIPNKVFTKVENEASFPGGQEEWVKYIVSKIKASIDSFTEKDFGTCLLKFIVNTDGSISNVEATTMKDTHLATTAINAVKTGPKWIPASQNNHVVAAYRLQPVTLTNPDKK